MEFALGYGDGKVTFSVPERNLIGIVEPNSISQPNFEAAFAEAWASPLGFPAPLDRLIRKGECLLLVVPDHTRKVPTAAILKAVWARLSRVVSPKRP